MTKTEKRVGMVYEPRFATPNVLPFNEVEWRTGPATLGNFHQDNVERPVFWSENATGVAAKLYFATIDGVKENSIRQLIKRVAAKVADEGMNHDYFRDVRSYENFYRDLVWLLLHQRAAFNTPVWLNLGVPGRHQSASACYLLSVDDVMLPERLGGTGDHSILDWINTEAAVFKTGAGSGTNLSGLRGDMEPLSTGGHASGPTSYMRFADAGAGTLKSGGTHRRAAKMVILDDDHPDVLDFADCKAREDDRMRALLAAGFEIDPFTPSGEKAIAESTSFQNANLSIGASDEFMRQAVSKSGEGWPLLARVDGKVTSIENAASMLRYFAERAHKCGDPGLVFLDRANKYHTTPMIDGKPSPITTCNPCAETWLNDDSSCNLASLNLLKFHNEDGEFLYEQFDDAVDVLVTAMDITCSFSHCPTPKIVENTRRLRQLGLGYSNLGATLMCLGMPYDSLEARDYAGALTSYMTGRAYRRSAELASVLGPYDLWEENKNAHANVIALHHRSTRHKMNHSQGLWDMWARAMDQWDHAAKAALRSGYRNSQATVIAPTGTISWLMDCDTTGCEVDFALVKYKGLAGGGGFQTVNQAVPRALATLGYTPEKIRELVSCLGDGNTEEFRASLHVQHVPVFDCANDISVEGHIDMVCAIQPFLSGAPSKTVNVAKETTVEQIEQAMVRAWHGGAKCISVFRDQSKVTAALHHVTKKAEDPVVEADIPAEAAAVDAVYSVRRRLPRRREAITHKFQVGDHEGYITVGKYPDGAPGEIFLTDMGKHGSFLSGMVGAFAIATSIALQYGAPLDVLANKFVGMEFEPRGLTDNPEIRNASSVPDYLFRWMLGEFGDADSHEAWGVLTDEVKAAMTARLDAEEALNRKAAAIDAAQGTLPATTVSGVVPTNGASNGHIKIVRGTRPCTCGGIMVQQGNCWTCQSDPSHNTGCG